MKKGVAAKWVVMLSLTLIQWSSFGQDVHFTQFHMQPLTINPALAGDYKGALRGSFINRRQWGQLGIPIQTLGASTEHKIWLSGDYLILGGLFLNDKTTQIGFETNRGYFSTAYQKIVSYHVFNIGVQVGFSSTSLDPDQTFPSQFNSSTGSFDTGLTNNEPGAGFNSSYLDINIGFFWKTIYQERYRFKTGASIAHINRPNEAFTNNVSRVPLRYLAHHSTEIIINRLWTFIVRAQGMYAGQAKEFITTAGAVKNLSNVMAIGASLGYRGYIVDSDAIVGILSFKYHYVDLGLSYDWNLSDLSTNSSQKTSVEFAITVRTPPPRKRKPVLYKKSKPCPIYIDPTQ